jgi:hypothetical protein
MKTPKGTGNPSTSVEHIQTSGRRGSIPTPLDKSSDNLGLWLRLTLLLHLRYRPHVCLRDLFQTLRRRSHWAKPILRRRVFGFPTRATQPILQIGKQCLRVRVSGCVLTARLTANRSISLISFRDAPSQHEVESLAKACQPATFGINQKDVLDETYRKAGKLDLTDFGINFDIHNSGLLESVRSSLFQSEDEERPIRAELYKLNVYGSSMSPAVPLLSECHHNRAGIFL